MTADWDNGPDFTCPGCFSLMIPPEHIPMQLSCGHIVCSACQNRFAQVGFPCRYCRRPIEWACVSSVLSNLALQYSRDHSTAVFLPESAQCTFLRTGRSYSLQRWYSCATCGLASEIGQGVCEACAKTCHKGHQCAYVSDANSFCDCMPSGNCCHMKPST